MCVICRRNVSSVNLTITCDVITVISLPYVKHLICINCPKLVSVCLMPKLQTLTCRECPQLREVHTLPIVKTIDCYDTNIQSLYDFVYLEKLIIKKSPCEIIENCPNLKHIN